MYSEFLSSYRNTSESLGELEKALKTGKSHDKSIVAKTLK